MLLLGLLYLDVVIVVVPEHDRFRRKRVVGTNVISEVMVIISMIIVINVVVVIILFVCLGVIVVFIEVVEIRIEIYVFLV